MILLGMTGPIGHGKSTFANSLATLVPDCVRLESSQIISQVANAWQGVLRLPPNPYDLESLNAWLADLPRAAEPITGIPIRYDRIKLKVEDVERHPVEYQKLIMHAENLCRHPNLLNQSINRDNKENYRPLLQWLGGYLVQKVDAGYWYRPLIQRARQAAADGRPLCIIGGLRFPMDAQLTRQSGGKIIKVYRPGYLQNDMLDPTERERDNIEPDSTIMSDGSVADVNRCAGRFWQDIQKGTLQKLYRTSDA